MRVILHDYDHARAEGLFSALPRQGLTVEDLPKAAIESGMAGLDEGAAVLLPVLLGLMPERDAAGQVRRMRAAGVANPLLVLQDDLDPDEVARILDAGADDVVGAPFAAVEIAARLRSVTRRHHGLRSQEVRSGALTVYLDGRHPEFDGQPIRLSGSIDLGVCSDVCIPERLDFDALLSPEAPRSAAISAALAARPYSASEAGVSRVTCALSPSADGLTIRARITMPSAGGTEVAVIESGQPLIWASEPVTHRDGGVLTATSELMHAEGGAIALDRSAVRLTILGTNHAVDIRGCEAG